MSFDELSRKTKPTHPFAIDWELEHRLEREERERKERLKKRFKKPSPYDGLAELGASFLGLPPLDETEGSVEPFRLDDVVLSSVELAAMEKLLGANPTDVRKDLAKAAIVHDRHAAEPYFVPKPEPQDEPALPPQPAPEKVQPRAPVMGTFGGLSIEDFTAMQRAGRAHPNRTELPPLTFGDWGTLEAPAASPPPPARAAVPIEAEERDASWGMYGKRFYTEPKNRPKPTGLPVREQLRASLIALGGDNPSPLWRQTVNELMGTEGGLFGTGVGAIDFVPFVGNAIGVEEAIRNDDPLGLLFSLLPAAKAAGAAMKGAKEGVRRVRSPISGFIYEVPDDAARPAVSASGNAADTAGNTLPRAGGRSARPFAGETRHQEDLPFFATHEAQPGAATGYMPGSRSATPAERAEFAADPRSSYALAPGGRDAIYGPLEGMGGIKEVLPTLPMQGAYRNAAGQWEVNPGFSARPHVDQTIGPDGRPMMTPEARQTLQAGETLRGAMGVQEVGAGHQVFFRPKGRSVFVPGEGPSNPRAIRRVQRAASPHGLPDVADTGQGLTITNFTDLPPELTESAITNILDAARARIAHRANVEGLYLPLTELWRQGEGALTRHVLNQLDALPEDVRHTFDNNPYIPKAAGNFLGRDKEWFERWGIGRADLERFRRIVAAGKGWVGRLEQALIDNPGTLPVIAGAFLGGLEVARQDDAEQNQSF